jgi:hypothetical protein
MWHVILAVALTGTASAALADVALPAPPQRLMPAVYSNEEQSYFAKEQGKSAIPLMMIRVDENGQMTSVDAFGQPGKIPIENMPFHYDENGIYATLADGTKLELRRARPATCWTAIPKKKPKPDGSPDWFFVRDVKLHDQGGRALVGGGDTGADPLVIRMRNVIWPPSADGKPATNKPSIVLYVHKPDQPDRAESYVWADPGAARIGINLRWMQASCGIDGAEPEN